MSSFPLLPSLGNYLFDISALLGQLCPMKKNPPRPDCNAGLELELARRRALHHVHDSARILADSVYFVPNMDARIELTAIIGALQTAERRLTDLEAKP